MNARTRKQYRYVLTEVWGRMEKQLSVGDVLIETEYKGLHADWTIANLRTGTPIGGMSGNYLPPKADAACIGTTFSTRCRQDGKIVSEGVL